MNDDSPAPADMAPDVVESALDVTPDDAPEETLEEVQVDLPEADDSTEESAPEVPDKEETPPYQPPQKIQVEVPQFEGEIPVDEYGNIDPAKLGEYLQARDKYILDAAKATSANTYYDNLYSQREWADVEQAYPELATDDHLRGLVDNLRTADAIKGGQGSLMEAAKAIDALRQSSVEKGRQDQQANITRQKTVSTTSASRTSPTPNRIATLRKQAAAGSDDARIAMLADLYESGALNA